MHKLRKLNLNNFRHVKIICYFKMACCADLDGFDINMQIDYELEDFNEYQGCEVVVPDVCL